MRLNSSGEFMCEVPEKAYCDDATGSNARLIDEVLRAQSQEADEELGDILVEGKDFARQCQERAGTNMPENMAEDLVQAVVSCLQQRYLGYCFAAPKGCTGRRMMDKHIANITSSTT